MSSIELPVLLNGVKKTVGEKLMNKITSCKILLVGSGGIGCELLKNLALSGFTHVEVIDLDTIDISNLNRQFLFRRQHVGMPKCTVACEAALAMLPSSKDDAKYIAHHGNVCDNSKFNVQYVSTFDLVFNALDNVAARRRVNRLCLAASVPLIEAGTTGYLGQVTVIDRESGVGKSYEYHDTLWFRIVYFSNLRYQLLWRAKSATNVRRNRHKRSILFVPFAQHLVCRCTLLFGLRNYTNCSSIQKSKIACFLKIRPEMKPAPTWIM